MSSAKFGAEGASEYGRTIMTGFSEGSLSKRIDSYLEQHGVRTQMNSNYLLNAFTIRDFSRGDGAGDFSKMVLVMDGE